MKNKLTSYNGSIPDTYEDNYLKLPFENILRLYRKKNILEQVKKYPHKDFLDVGCGAEPMFEDFNDFDNMTVVEPGKLFYEMAIKKSNSAPNILIINDVIENQISKLHSFNFDFIVLGGFLHEINNPHDVLKSVKKLCGNNTLLYSFVPNVRSFHRLLALEMGIIQDIHQKSGHDKLFERKNSYGIVTFNELLSRNGFKVIDSGSYFIKPFTNDQMSEMLNQKIITKSVLDGLDSMIKYLPEMGAEIWNCCKKDD